MSSSLSKSAILLGIDWFKKIAAFSRFSEISLNLAILWSSLMNCDGTEFGKTTKNGGSNISAPGIKMKKLNGTNLMTSVLI